MPPTREPYKHYHNDALANILFLASLQDQLFHSLEYWTGLDLRLIYFLDYFLTFFHFFPTAPSYLVLPEFCLTVPGTEGKVTTFVLEQAVPLTGALITWSLKIRQRGNRCN